MQENQLTPSLLAWVNRQLQTSAAVGVASVTPLRVEASNRQFYRLTTNHNSMILMSSPPSMERNNAFCDLATLFHHRHVPVPLIHARNMQQGWFLMQDLGDLHLEEVYATDARKHAVKLAVELLTVLAPIRDHLIEPYDQARMQMEVQLFNEWFVKRLLGLPEDLPQYQDSYDLLLQAMLSQPQGCVHRDYHCRNLLYRPDAHRPLGVVDFQDALHGPILYDLASLLRDCYYVFGEDEINHWLDHYISIQPVLAGYPRQQLQTWFDLTAIQRQLKAIGIFARLHLRDGKASHLPYIPPLLARVRRLCHRYPQLSQLEVQLSSCESALLRSADSGLFT